MFVFNSCRATWWALPISLFRGSSSPLSSILLPVTWKLISVCDIEGGPFLKSTSKSEDRGCTVSLWEVFSPPVPYFANACSLDSSLPVSLPCCLGLHLIREGPRHEERKLGKKVDLSYLMRVKKQGFICLKSCLWPADEALNDRMKGMRVKAVTLLPNS